MNKDCMVSILCTAYNHEKYIAQALDSFLMQQTDFDFEVLVSDDASTDGTAAIISQYAEENPDIIRPFLMETNQFSRGVNIYTDYFFPNAKGKYICYCEGDDFWTDDTKLQRQVDFLESHPDYSACVHNTMLHYCDGVTPDRPLLHHEQDMDLPMELMVSGASQAFHTSSHMSRKEVITNTQPFYHVAYQYGFTDQANNIWFALNGKIRYINRIMSVYRINSNSAAWSSGVDGEYNKLRHFIQGKLEMLKSLREQIPPEYMELVDKTILEREFELMYIEGRDREQRRGAYRQLLKQQPKSYRIKNFIKSYVPGVQKIYRKRQGYVD